MEHILDKYTLVLQSLIKEFIKSNEPIGSEYVKKNIDLKISSATIRNYFKKMMQQGLLHQEHTSGGRIPTPGALKTYWSEKLQSVDDIYIPDINLLKTKADKLDIFCIIKFLEDNFYRHCINISQCYLVLVFDKGQFVIQYNVYIENLLKQFANTHIDELYLLCEELGLKEICKNIKFLTKNTYLTINKQAILNLFRAYENMSCDNVFTIISNDYFNKTPMGISYFDNEIKNIMKLKSHAIVEGKNAEIICISEIKKDFDNFFAL